MRYSARELNMSHRCEVCDRQYVAKNSNASYKASFCSAKCEQEYTQGWK